MLGARAAALFVASRVIAAIKWYSKLGRLVLDVLYAVADFLNLVMDKSVCMALTKMFSTCN
jgi:hypothetical protein